MPDTIRTLGELNALFDDATIPTNQDIRDAFLSMLVHGVIGIIDNAVVQSVDTSYAGNEIVFPTELHARGVVANTVAGTLTTPAELTTAKYDIGWELNVQGQGNPNQGAFTVAVFKNGATKLNALERTFQIAGTEWEHVYCRVPGVTLAGGDTIQLAIISESGTKDVLIVNGQLSCQRLGLE